ncbi:hypothetical protein HYT02_00565 [Candidatus Gottesmanbacteria bacterium]|nr:hypothetical protein [Candidatus Gottesmanbacteria bacterium]
MIERKFSSFLTEPEKEKVSDLENKAILMRNTADPFSPQEYLSIAVMEAAKAILRRDKAVGTIISWREEGIETIISASNRVRSGFSHGFHAEQLAIYYLELFLYGVPTPDTYFQRLLPENIPQHHGGTLYTTLEPCTTCAGRILQTPEITSVVVGAEDPNGGQMLSNRLECIAPNFQEKAQKRGLTIDQVDFNNPKSQHHVSPLYQQLIQETLGPRGIDLRFSDEVRNGILFDINKKTFGRR